MTCMHWRMDLAPSQALAWLNAIGPSGYIRAYVHLTGIQVAALQCKGCGAHCMGGCALSECSLQGLGSGEGCSCSAKVERVSHLLCVIPASCQEGLAPHCVSAEARPAAEARVSGRGWQNLALVQGVVQLAAKKGCTPGQLALAWVQVRPDAGRLAVCDKNCQKSG